MAPNLVNLRHRGRRLSNFGSRLGPGFQVFEPKFRKPIRQRGITGAGFTIYNLKFETRYTEPPLGDWVSNLAIEIVKPDPLRPLWRTGFRNFASKVRSVQARTDPERALLPRAVLYGFVFLLALAFQHAGAQRLTGGRTGGGFGVAFSFNAFIFILRMLNSTARRYTSHFATSKTFVSLFVCLLASGL